MVWTIASFEFHQRLHRISTYVYFLVFLLLGVLFAAMSGGAIPNATVEFGTGGKVLVNSPYALNAIISYVAFFGLVITAAIARAAARFIWSLIAVACADSAPRKIPGNARTLLIWFG